MQHLQLSPLYGYLSKCNWNFVSVKLQTTTTIVSLRLIENIRVCAKWQQSLRLCLGLWILEIHTFSLFWFSESLSPSSCRNNSKQGVYIEKLGLMNWALIDIWGESLLPIYQLWIRFYIHMLKSFSNIVSIKKTVLSQLTYTILAR